MDIGHRPGKIIGLDIAELHALADTSTGSGSSNRAEADQDTNPDLAHLVDITKSHDIEELRRQLGSTLVVVTHDLALTARFDRRLTLEAGRFVETP